MSKFATLLVKNLTTPLNEGPQTGTSPLGAPPSASLGERFYDPTAVKSYQYVKFTAGTGSVATANGAVAYWLGNPANFTVTSKLANAGATTAANNQNFVAGIFLGVVTTGNFTVIQTGGIHSAVIDTTAADKQGCAVIASATTDGEAVGVAAGTAPTNRVIGWATADQGSGTIAVNIALDRDL
jgi:hypothetical protein